MLAAIIVFITITLGLSVGIIVGWATLAAVLHLINWGNKPATVVIRSASATQKLPAVEPQPVA